MGSSLLDRPASHKPGLVLAIVSRNDEVDASVDAYNITDVREITRKRLITARDKRQPRDLVRDPSVQSVEKVRLELGFF